MKPIYIAGAVIIVGILVLSVLPKSNLQTRDELKKFSSYDELQQFVKNSAEESQVYDNLGLQTRTTNGALGAMATAESAPSASGADKSFDYSGTNVQVADVDEPDFVKNDGRYIYTVSGGKLVIIDAYPAETAKIVTEMDFTNSSVNNIFINRDRLIVFGNEYTYYQTDEQTREPQAEKMIGIYPIYNSQSAFIKVYDVSDRSNPILVKNISAEGYYFDARMVGDYVYAVINQPVYGGDVVPLPIVRPMQADFPDIYYFDIPDRSYNYVNIIALNTQDGSYASKAFMLPSSQNIFMSQENIYLSYVRWLDYRYFYDKIVDDVIIPIFPELTDRINEIRGYNISRYAQFTAIDDLVENHLGELSPERRISVEETAVKRMEEFQAEIAKEQQKTIINKISLSGSEINYIAQGSVPGYVLNQFSMDEHDGYFRIATTVNGGGFSVQPIGVATVGSVETVSAPSQGGGGSGSAGSAAKTEVSAEIIATEPAIAPPMPPRTLESVNNLYVLDSSMNTVGKVEDLAPGESIFSARFAGDRAYVVTFRQVDPFFVIDLSDTTNPKVLGQLKISGVSNYLQPVDDNHIIGIGKDATDEGMLKGLKISLFDVSDVANPVEVSKVLIGDRGSDSPALYDHKAVLIDVQKNLMVLPITVAEIDRSKYTEPLPNWAYGEIKWQGAYVFLLDNLKIRGRIDHATNDTQEFENYYGQYAVSRSLYIGNVLYTLSNKLVKMNSLDSLNEINSIELPGYEQLYPIY